jgi:hypothetical protein
VAPSIEKLGADVFLQQTKLPRYGGLYQAKELRGAGHVARVGHGKECAELSEIHGQFANRDGSIRKFYFTRRVIRSYDS